MGNWCYLCILTLSDKGKGLHHCWTWVQGERRKSSNNPQGIIWPKVKQKEVFLKMEIRHSLATREQLHLIYLWDQKLHNEIYKIFHHQRWLVETLLKDSLLKLFDCLEDIAIANTLSGQSLTPRSVVIAALISDPEIIKRGEIGKSK